MNREELIEELNIIKKEINFLKIERSFVVSHLLIWSSQTFIRGVDLVKDPNIYGALAVGLCAFAVSMYDFHLNMDKEEIEDLKKEQYELEKEVQQKELIYKTQ